MQLNNITVAVIGLGYVGIPLAVEFGKKNGAIGFYNKQKLVDNYRKHHAPMGEVSSEQFESARYTQYTSDQSKLSEADFILVAVPNPVNEAHQPDLSPLISTVETVGRNIKKVTAVVFTSTVCKTSH